MNNSSSFTFRKNGPPVSEVVYQHLRSEIVSMRLAPGEVLKEKDVAAQFGVSRTPVREAILRLCEERLLDVVPQRGTFVAPIRLADVWDAQCLRVAVELALVRSAALKATPESIRKLTRIVEDQKYAAERNDYEYFFRLDDDFHAFLAKIGGHPALWMIINSAKAHLDRIRHLSLPESNHSKNVLAEHEVILHAIEKMDPDLAEAALKAHLGRFPLFVAAMVENTPELFADIESNHKNTQASRE